MAESGDVEIAGTPVQELVLNPQNMPKNYIYEEGGSGFRDALLPSQDDDIPVIDLHRLSSPFTAQQELAKLHHALHSWGCFQVPLSTNLNIISFNRHNTLERNTV